MGHAQTPQTQKGFHPLQQRPTAVTKPLHPTAAIHPVLQLQRQIGNQAVMQLIQAKLKVGQPGDVFEQEADRTADQVMRMPDPMVQRQAEDKKEETVQAKPLIQRQAEEKEQPLLAKPAIGAITPWMQRQVAAEKKEEPVQMLQRQATEEKKEEPIQRQAAEEKKEEPIQRQATEEKKEESVQTKEANNPTREVTPALEGQIQAMRGGGEPLPETARTFFESRFGYDFSGVRVHSSSQSDDIARKINAQAFTIRQDIFFAAGRYEPHTTQGRWLLSHELTHTLQQNSPRPLTATSPTAQAQGTANLSSALVQRQQKAGIPLSSTNSPGLIARKATLGAKAPASPAQDPAFQKVVERVKRTAKKEKKHAPAKTKATEAQTAAVSPTNEVASKASAGQVQQMDQQQPKPFNRASFKAALLTKIAAVAPKTLKEADEFKESGKLGSVKGDLTGQVDTSKKQSQGAIEAKVKATPDPSGIEPRVATPLPPTPAGAAPASVGAIAAAPKPKTADEVSLQEGSQSLDQKMAEADVTDEQLKKSNEPDFQSASDAKKEAQTDAVTAPQAYRQGEQAILKQAQTQANTTAQTQLAGMHAVRGQRLHQVVGNQQQTKSKDEQERTRVANEIQAIYNQTKQKAEERLNRLDGEVNQAFDQGASEAQKAFEDYVERRMGDYKDDRYGGLSGPLLWAKDKLLGMPSEVNAFYQEGRSLYLIKMDAVLDKVAAIVETGLNQAKAEIAKGRKAVQEFVKKQPLSIRQAAQQAAKNIQSQFDQLEQSVNDKQDQLIDSLAQKYNEKLQAIDARIEEMKAQNRGLVDKAIGAIAGVIKTILALKNMLLNVLSKAASAIGKIIKHPIAFLGNLVAGVKQGFMSFVDNIAQHLQKGLMGWLFGAISEAGIQLPEGFDLKSIFALVMQVLGMTWAFIRSRAVKIFGERVVKILETVAEPFKILITQGPGGLWEYIKEQLSYLQDVVVEGIKSFVENSIIKAGISWIMGLLNPAGAFIKACKAIYDIIMFFVERGSQILALVNAVLDSVSAISDGAIGAAASAVENALSKAVPVVISFLASLLGVTGISEKIRSIITRIQEPIIKAIDWVINKAYNLVKSAGKLLGFGKEKQDDPEHSRKVEVGLAQIHQEEAKYGQDGKITLENARKVAAAVKQKNSVFQSITVIDGGNTWRYHYVASPAEDEPSKLEKAGEKADCSDPTTRLKDCPDMLKVMEAAAKRDFTVLLPVNLPGGTNADTTLVRVYGPNNASFFRGRIRYDLEKTTTGHLYHEVNHLDDFISGRVPAPYAIYANNAEDFQQLKGMSLDTLIGEFSKRKSPSTDKEVQESHARKAVSEIRNSLRDMENLFMRRNEQGQLKVKPGMEEEFENSVRQIRKYVSQLRGQFSNQPELKEYVRTFVQSSFPELPEKYRTVNGGDFIGAVGL